MYTIYGKENCRYCADAKALLERAGVEYEFKDVMADKEAREEIRERVPNAKTVPQIFIGETYIGGYDDLTETTAMIPFVEHE